MPPVKQPDTVHWVQDDLHTLFTAQVPPTTDRRILEHQSHSMMPHVRAHINCEQGKYHSHHNRNKDEVEGRNLQEAAVLVRIGMDILILNGGLQLSHTLAP